MADTTDRGSDLERTAARFDEMYTELTGIQRELIQAVRDGRDDREAAELRERASTILAATNIAQRAWDVTRLDYRTVEAAALRARILERPDPHLLAAALGATGRTHAYPILDAALGQYSDTAQLPAAFGDNTVDTVLAMPRGVSLGTARKLARHHELDPATPITDLDSAQLTQLRKVVRDAAGGLPDGIEDWRRRMPKSPQSGKGAGAAVLQAWTEQVVPAAETARDAALEASRREGWPEDAVEVAERLHHFTEQHVAGLLLTEWDRLLAATGAGRLEAMRVEERDTRERGHDGDEDAWSASVILRTLIEVRKQVTKARRLLNGPEDEWGSSTPLALSRLAGRRCGDLLSWCEAEAANPLLEQLP